MRTQNQAPIGKLDMQELLALIRLFIFGIGLVIAIGAIGTIYIDGLDPHELADNLRKSVWFMQKAPEWIVILSAVIFNYHTFRYMIAPLSAIVFVMIAGALYVQDIYALPNFKSAMTYVLYSVLGLDYPTVIIDKGTKEFKQDKDTLIDKIGGPGFVVIQPGNAAMFRELRRPSEAGLVTTYFLNPFETIAQTVNLDEQQGKKEEMSAMTRDGIKVKICDIHFRYRVKQDEQNGVTVRRTLERPYPISEQTIRNMTFNLQVQKNGLESWTAAIERSVTGTISDYVAANLIDDLTAPRTSQKNSRLELRKSFFEPDMRGRLAKMGAELLWVDVGHVEIEDETVDEVRTNLWSSDWAGDAKEDRAYGDAIRQAYHELGRAEVQADLIMSIANALRDVNLTNPSSDNIRKVLLARTAQILRTMSDSAKEKRDAEERGLDRKF